MAKVMIILLILSLLIGVFQFQRKNMTVMVGMSLAFAIVLSLTATLGTLFPLVVFTPGKLNSPGARLLFLALGSIVLGIILCAWAGAKREAAAASEESGTPAAFWCGVTVCVLSGIFSPMLNFSFATGEQVIRLAQEVGTPVIWSINPVWALALSAAFPINAFYCLSTLKPAASWAHFSESTSGKRGGRKHDRDFAPRCLSLLRLGGHADGNQWGIGGMGDVYVHDHYDGQCLGFADEGMAWSPRQAYFLLASGLAVILAAIILVAAANATL